MATETLRPNGAGDTTIWGTQYPGTGSHYDKVDEAVADDDDTYIDSGEDTGATDLFALANHSVGSGTITKVTVYARMKESGTANAKIVIKTGGTEYTSDYVGTTTSWADYSAEWGATNPKTKVAWTWDDIDALQAGVYAYTTAGHVYCTQVYVEVEYGASSYSQHIML